jgi:hypothetical protein
MNNAKLNVGDKIMLTKCCRNEHASCFGCLGKVGTTIIHKGKTKILFNHRPNCYAREHKGMFTCEVIIIGKGLEYEILSELGKSLFGED